MILIFKQVCEQIAGEEAQPCKTLMAYIHLWLTYYKTTVTGLTAVFCFGRFTRK